VLITNTFLWSAKYQEYSRGGKGGGEKKTEETRKDSDKIFPLLPRDATVQAPVSEVQKDRADTIFWPTSQMGHTGSMDCTGWEEDKEF